MRPLARARKLRCLAGRIDPALTRVLSCALLLAVVTFWALIALTAVQIVRVLLCCACA